MSDGDYVSKLASCLSGTRSYLKLCVNRSLTTVFGDVSQIIPMYEQKHDSNQVIKDGAIFTEPS